MTSFADHVTEYLRLRRSFGFKLQEHERLLRKFAAHMDDLGAETVTIERALGWALERDLPAGSVVAATRLLVVRGFARYMIGLDPRTEIPPTQLIPVRRQRRAPFIYTSADIAALMEHARTGISYRLVAATHETLIGLLAVTGMRISEAIKLDRADVNWTDGLLLVRESKFNKSRYLPLDPSTLEALKRYAALRDRLCPNPLGSSFFVSLRHGRLNDCAVQKTFRRVCQQAGVGATAPFAPRLHDLRHSLAVNTLLGWYRDGVDVHARLPVLSTYLGHLNPTYTYYYLSAAPELLAHAAGMRDAYWKELA